MAPLNPMKSIWRWENFNAKKTRTQKFCRNEKKKKEKTMTNQTITFSGQSCLLTYDHWWRSCAHEHAHTLCTRPHLNSNNNENAVLVSLCIRRFFISCLFVCGITWRKTYVELSRRLSTHTSNIIIHTHETHFVFTHAHINVIFKCFICSNTTHTSVHTVCT